MERQERPKGEEKLIIHKAQSELLLGLKDYLSEEMYAEVEAIISKKLIETPTKEQKPTDEDLLKGAKQLIECDHQEHFAVRLNDEVQKLIDLTEDLITCIYHELDGMNPLSKTKRTIRNIQDWQTKYFETSTNQIQEQNK